MNRHPQQLQHRKHGAGVRDERGTALIIAITLLFLFVMLGGAYLKFGFIEVDETNLELRDARARQLAEAGVQAAIGRVHQALHDGDVVSALGSSTLSLPMYVGDREAVRHALRPLTNDEGTVEIVGTVETFVTDESGKVNLNHAPASVLQRVLEVDGTTARAITASLPRADGANDRRRWLLNSDELVSRKLLTPEQYRALDLSNVTTFTVVDHETPGAYFSVNTAPAEVLAAVLSIPVEQAQQVKAKGPYNTIEALAEAAGREVSTLAPGETVGSFLLQPNTFHIVSTATYTSKVSARSTARVETVVRFNEAGGYDTLHWRVSRAAVAPPVESDLEPAVDADAEAEPVDAEAEAEAEAEAPEEEAEVPASDEVEVSETPAAV